MGYIDEINLLGEGVTGTGVAPVTKTAIASINGRKYVYNASSLKDIAQLTTVVTGSLTGDSITTVTATAKGKESTDTIKDGDSVVFTLKTTTGFEKDMEVTVLSIAQNTKLTAVDTAITTLAGTKSVANVEAVTTEYNKLTDAEKTYVSWSAITDKATFDGYAAEVANLRKAEAIIKAEAGFSAATYNTEALLDAHIQSLLNAAGLGSTVVTFAPTTAAGATPVAPGTRSYKVVSKTTTTLEILGILATIVS